MKNCFVVLGNKKKSLFSEECNKVLHLFSSNGWFFDKVVFVTFDDGECIVNQLDECRLKFESTVIYAPIDMEQTLKDYIAKSYGGYFSVDQLHTESANVFLLYAGNAFEKAQKEVLPYLTKRYGEHFGKLVFKTVGATSADIEKAIARAKAVDPNVEYTFCENFGDAKLEIIYDDNTPKMLLDEVSRAVVSVLGDNLYALEDISLAEQLYRLLTLRRMKIAVCESFTGGGVGQKLVEVPGISSVFYEGLNTYSNQSKMARLGVKEQTLKQYGAVSEETAYQMAAGLIMQGNCDISIATTGIAGPKSDNTNKPVGLCYIAIGCKDFVAVDHFVLKGDRENITKTAIHLALFLAYKRIK